MLNLYNTLTRKKEKFKPIKKNQVGMYTCGPTVYWYAHIGNLRTYVFEDILKRVLLYNGYKVKHVMNITDVGHLTSDGVREDKLELAIDREGLKRNKESMLMLANRYTKAFKQDIKKLNILFPNIWCKATEHVHDMIKLVKRIEKNGYTYKTKVGLRFDTSKFKYYAELGRLKLEDLKEGARVELDPEKRNPADFALWLTNKPKHIMQWDSPWGKGFPGWHIECSAMSMKYLGEQFDIHAGGKDLIPVHHTNEIAQAESATGKHPWVRYWLHGEFLLMKKGKMAKTTGEFLTLDQLIEKGYRPLDYRYFCLTAHYKQQLGFSFEALNGARNSLSTLEEKVLEFKENPTSKGKSKVREYKERFLEEINNDLNMPKALVVLWSVVKDKGLGSKEKLNLIYDFDKVLGLDLKEVKRVKVPKKIEDKSKKRERLRKEKKWKEADKLRKEVEKEGYIIEDTAEGPLVKKKVF